MSTSGLITTRPEGFWARSATLVRSTSGVSSLPNTGPATTAPASATAAIATLPATSDRRPEDARPSPSSQGASTVRAATRWTITISSRAAVNTPMVSIRCRSSPTSPTKPKAKTGSSMGSSRFRSLIAAQS